VALRCGANLAVARIDAIMNLSSSPFIRLVLGVTATAALAGTTAVPASADSITFVKDRNVWVANADGTGAVPLTADGAGYGSTSQADDGMVVAQRGKQIARIDRQGNMSLLDSVTTKMPNAPVGGPWDPEISPDGTKLAYWVGAYGSYYDPSSGINFISTGQFTLWADAHTGDITGMTNWHQTPSWVGDSSGALLWDPTATISPQAVFATPNQNHNDVVPWFRDRLANNGDEVLRQVGQGEISRSGNRLVAVRSSTWVGSSQLHENGNQIVVYDVVAGYDQPPAMRPCAIQGQNGTEVGNPQLSPDGNTVLWEEAAGIYASDISGGGCGTPRLIIPGGYRPDWGIAARGNGRPPEVKKDDNKKTDVVVKKDDKKPEQAPTAAVAGKVKSKSLSKGLAVIVTCPVACATKVSVRDGRRQVGTKHAALAAGRHTLRVKLAAKDRRRFGHKGHRKLAVTIVAGTTTITKTVVVVATGGAKARASTATEPITLLGLPTLRLLGHGRAGVQIALDAWLTATNRRGTTITIAGHRIKGPLYESGRRDDVFLYARTLPRGSLLTGHHYRVTVKLPGGRPTTHTVVLKPRQA
jgi:hypothetical protein